MSVNVVDNDVTVTASQEVEVANEVVTNTIVNEYPNTINVKSNEFAVVGDGLFATTKEEVPGWMRELVGDLVTSATADAYYAMAGFNYNLYNAMLALQVAENKYQQAINRRITDQEAFVQAVETLNSTVQNAEAEIVGIKQTYATKDFAMATVATTLEASLNGGAIKSSLGQLATTMSNQYGTMAQRMDVLESTFEDLEQGVEGYANATNTLETYVGITGDKPDGTGLLATVTDLQDQVDNKVESWFTISTDDPKTAWTDTVTRSYHNGDLWYQTDTKKSYYYKSSTNTWNLVEDVTALTALENASKAQATADGIVVSYVAIEQSTAPSTSKLWLTDAKELKQYTSSWNKVSTKKGDTLTTYVTATKDTKVYVYNGTSWVTETSTGLVASSKAVTDLKIDLTTLNNSIYAESGLQQTLEGKIINGVATAESKFAYNSNITINNKVYSTGFGLSNSAGTGVGSEFWINADKLKFTNSNKTGRTAPFTIDASGTTPQITFNGKVSFSNVTSVPAYTLPGDVANAISRSGFVLPADVANAINTNTTTINGAKIATGSINVMDVAVGNVISSGNYVPNTSGWSINNNGNAEMNNVRIRGDVSSTGALKSSTYVAGSTGWIISGNGSAEFNNIRLRINLSSVVTVPSFNPGTLITNSWLSVGSWTINPPDVIGGGYVTASFSVTGIRTEGSYLDLNARLWINGEKVAQVYNGGSATSSVTVSGGLGYRVDYPVTVKVEVYSYVYKDGYVSAVSGSITNAA